MRKALLRCCRNFIRGEFECSAAICSTCFKNEDENNIAMVDDILTIFDESEIQSAVSKTSSDSSSGSNDQYEFNSNRSLSSNDSSINADQLREETRLNLGEEAISFDESSLESNDLEDIAFVSSNCGDSLENEVDEKHWTDQKALLHDPTRSAASHFVLNNYFRILNRKVPTRKNAKSSFIMQQLV